MKRAVTALIWAQAGWTGVIIAYTLFGKGRPEANAHPTQRPAVGEGWY